jgi:hypothetical protein
MLKYNHSLLIPPDSQLCHQNSPYSLLTNFAVCKNMFMKAINTLFEAGHKKNKKYYRGKYFALVLRVVLPFPPLGQWGVDFYELKLLR